MSQEQPVIAVHELRILVEPGGIKIIKHKMPCRETDTNYLPVKWRDEFGQEGYNYWRHQRISKDLVGVVRRTGMFDSTDRVDYEIYYLEGQEDAAVSRIETHISEVIATMKKNMDATHDAWTTR